MACEIITNLWLGNIIDSRNIEFLNMIDVVINCTKDLPFNNKNNKQIRLSVHDNLEKEEIVNMYKYLDKTVSILHKHLSAGKRVFVHCYAGKQRSATVVCAFIMKFLSLTYEETVELVKTKRMIIFTPLPNFDAALKLYEKDLDKERNK